MAVASLIVYLASMFYMMDGAVMRVFGQQQNITIGSSLNTGSKWVSPNGEFAFGFFKTTPGLYSVGIWLDKIPTKTVVWTANSDGPIQEGSTLQLSNRGLQLSHSRTKTVELIIDVDPQSADAAAMKDDGNLVLLDKSNGILWESFGHPTDTLLPGQVLQSGSTLFSKSPDANHSTGRFVLSLQENLELSSADRRRESYWSPDSGIIGIPTSLTFDRKGLLSLVGRSINYTIWDGTGYAGAVYKRVTLGEDGVLRGYIRMGDEASLWRVDWRALDDPCRVQGQCGLNGFCRLNTNNSTECSCPPGFDLVDRDKRFKGCSRSPLYQDCSPKSVMQSIGTTDWPGNDYASLIGLNETECKQACLEDCMCVVAVFGPPKSNTATCWKKAMPLRDGITGADRATFVKISPRTICSS